MTLRPVTPPQHPAEARRAQVERQVSVQDGVTRLTYLLTFSGAGEQIVTVNFPCRFIDLPACSDSFHMEPGSVLEDRNFPWASCGALFDTEERAGHTYYIGAKLIAVMGGGRRQRMTVHWTAEGKAIVGPVTE